MKKPTQGLLAGIAISTLTLAGGALAKRYFEGLADRHEAQAIQVHKQNDACWNKIVADTKKNPIPPGGITLDEALRGGSPCAGYDAQSADEHVENDYTAAVRANSWSRKAAIIVMAILSAPWLWHFLLRRVAELGAAYRGEPRA